MKHVLLVFILMAGLSACNDDEPVYSVTPELQPYVTTFFTEAEARGKSLPQVNLIAELGHCQAVVDMSKDDEQWILRLDPDFYEYYTEGQIEAIVFHELAKALLQRPILDVPFGPEPVSIMNPYYKFGEYGAKRTELLDELFK